MHQPDIHAEVSRGVARCGPHTAGSVRGAVRQQVPDRGGGRGDEGWVRRCCGATVTLAVREVQEMV